MASDVESYDVRLEIPALSGPLGDWIGSGALRRFRVGVFGLNARLASGEARSFGPRVGRARLISRFDGHYWLPLGSPSPLGNVYDFWPLAPLQLALWPLRALRGFLGGRLASVLRLLFVLPASHDALTIEPAFVLGVRARKLRARGRYWATYDTAAKEYDAAWDEWIRSADLSPATRPVRPVAAPPFPELIIERPGR